MHDILDSHGVMAALAGLAIILPAYTPLTRWRAAYAEREWAARHLVAAPRWERVAAFVGIAHGALVLHSLA